MSGIVLIGLIVVVWLVVLAPLLLRGQKPIRKAGEAFDETGTRSTLICDAMRETIRFMTTGVQQEYFIVGGWLNELQNIAMGLDQFVRVESLRQLEAPFNVTAVPKGSKGRFNPVIANSWVITQTASPQSQQAAWQWIEHYSSVPIQKAWALHGDASPANMVAAREVFLDPKASPSGMRDLIHSMQDADWVGNNPVWAAWYIDGWGPIIDRAARGELSPEEAMIQANLAAQNALDSFYKENN